MENIPFRLLGESKIFSGRGTVLLRSAYGNPPLPPPLAHSAVCTLTIKFLSMQEVRRPDPDLPGGGRLHESGGGRGVRFRLGEGDLRAAGRSAARILAHTGK